MDGPKVTGGAKMSPLLVGPLLQSCRFSAQVVGFCWGGRTLQAILLQLSTPNP